jgi:hypothetical protein
MLFTYDDDKRSYCGKSLLPFGLRRRRAVCFTSAPPRWMAVAFAADARIPTRRRSQRCSRDFYHGLLGAGNG